MKTLRYPYLSHFHPANATEPLHKAIPPPAMVAPSTRNERVPDSHPNDDYIFLVEALKEALADNRVLSDELDTETARSLALEVEVRDRQDEGLKVRQERDAAFDALDFTPCDLCWADGTTLLCDRCWVRFLDMTSALVRRRFSQC